MAFLGTILKDESQTVGNSLQHSSSSALNPTKQPIGVRLVLDFHITAMPDCFTIIKTKKSPAVNLETHCMEFSYIFVGQRWSSQQSPQLQIGRPGFEACLAKNRHIHVKSLAGTIYSKFPSKLYLWGYQSGGAIPSRADQN